MPTINIQADISVDLLMRAVEQLDDHELRHFTSQLLALNAKRAAPSITQTEAELLARINRRLPSNILQRYHALIAKRDAEMLSDAGHRERLQFTERVEAFDVARVETLAQLAAQRRVTLSVLMRQLDVESPADE